MAILSIRILGDPVLRSPAEEVTEFGPDLAKLIEDMMETMLDVKGAGLAAPQVGVGKRIFTYAVGDARGHVVNPVLVSSDDLQPEGPEGCLSVPGLGFPVPRYRWSRVTGVDKDGNPVDLEATGVLARCFQHETDHLNGTVYVDRLDGENRKAAMRAIRGVGFTDVTARTVAGRARTVGSAFGAAVSGTRP